MRPPTLDPTAGETARASRLHPRAPERVADPTDARYGELLSDAWQHASDAPRTVDPTNPACGEPPD
jgi:hypothetical protein